MGWCGCRGFLFIYLKGDVERLTSRQKDALKDVVRQIKKELELES